MAKETFILRTEWWDAISELDKDDRSDILEMLFLYHLEEEVQTPSSLSVRLVWKLLEPNLKRNISYYDKRGETSKENGKLGGRKPNNNLKEPKEPIVTLSDTDTDTDSDSETVNLKLDDLLSFFDFDYQNSKHINQARLGLAFLNHLTKQNQIEYFFNQFAAYKQIKTKEPTYKHSLKTFIGSQENCFEDGKWMDVNWVEKSKVKPEAEVVYFSQAEKNRAIRIASKC